MPLDVSEEASQPRLTGILMILIRPTANELSSLPVATSRFDRQAACQGQPLSHLPTSLMCRQLSEASRQSLILRTLSSELLNVNLPATRARPSATEFAESVNFCLSTSSLCGSKWNAIFKHYLAAPLRCQHQIILS